MSKPASYPEIKKYVDGIRLIDTHEHLPQEEEQLQQNVDFLATFFGHYASVDLRSAGMSEDEYRKMMVEGGRSPEGNRYTHEWEEIQP